MSVALGALPIPLVSRYRSLFAAVEAGARSEGCTGSLHAGIRYHRLAAPAVFRKTPAFGVTLNLAVQGRKVARFGGRELAYDPAHYLVVTGETQFDGCVVDASRERPYLGVTIEIPAEAVVKTLAALADREAAPEVEVLPAFVAELDDAVASAVERLLRSVDDPLERAIVAPLAVEELVFRLLRSDAASVLRRAVAREANAGAIQRAMAFMRANAGRPLSVQAVARHVAMSPSHFAHRFRALARVSPMRYLKQVRLAEARLLLLGGGLGVGEAAQRVGYESASHFTRDFKSTFGAAPADYVRGVRGTAAPAASAGSGK